MNNDKRVTAVVVTYNRKQLLKECISGLLGQNTQAQLEILIIDNASNDGTRDYIDDLVDGNTVRYINTGNNLGGAGGFEYGIRAAVKDNCDYIWIMDDDTIPSETALEELVNAAKELAPFGFLSSKALWTDGSICTMNVQRKDIARKLPLSAFDKRIIPVQYATFVSLFFTKEIVLEAGAPIGEFFIWGDDWEYTRRLSKKYPSYVITDSLVTHKTQHNQGCDISNDVFERIERYKIGFRNGVYVTRQDGLKGRVYWVLNLGKNVMKILLSSRGYKKERFKVLAEGIKEGFRFHPKKDNVLE